MSAPVRVWDTRGYLPLDDMDSADLSALVNLRDDRLLHPPMSDLDDLMDTDSAPNLQSNGFIDNGGQNVDPSCSQPPSFVPDPPPTGNPVQVYLLGCLLQMDAPPTGSPALAGPSSGPPPRLSLPTGPLHGQIPESDPPPMGRLSPPPMGRLSPPPMGRLSPPPVSTTTGDQPQTSDDQGAPSNNPGDIPASDDHGAPVNNPVETFEEPGEALPVLGSTSAALKLAHVIRSRESMVAKYDSGTPVSGTVALPDSWVGLPAGAPPYPSITVEEEIWKRVVTQHKLSLLRISARALLFGASCTYNDIEQASELILQRPPDPLFTELKNLCAFHYSKDISPAMNHRSLSAKVRTDIGLALARNLGIRNSVTEEKVFVGSLLENTFIYAFDVVLGKKDSSLFKLREGSGTARDLVKKIDVISTTMTYAHAVFIVDRTNPPFKVTEFTHYEVDDFLMESLSSSVLGLKWIHKYHAYLRLRERMSTAEVSGPNAIKLKIEEQDLLDHPPEFRTGEDGLLYVTLPGGLREVYGLNYQAPAFLFTAKFWFEELHIRTSQNGQRSAVQTMKVQQEGVEAGSPEDLLYRAAIIPLAIVVTALYVARENPLHFLAAIDGRTALLNSPTAVIVFQMKILFLERALEEWNRKGGPGPRLLRKRLLAIMEDVTTEVDDHFHLDLMGPGFHLEDSVHLAYGQSRAVMEQGGDDVNQPFVTRAATLLETSQIASDRDVKSLLSVLAEKCLSNPALS